MKDLLKATVDQMAGGSNPARLSLSVPLPSLGKTHNQLGLREM